MCYYAPHGLFQRMSDILAIYRPQKKYAGFILVFSLTVSPLNLIESMCLVRSARRNRLTLFYAYQGELCLKLIH